MENTTRQTAAFKACCFQRVQNSQPYNKGNAPALAMYESKGYAALEPAPLTEFRQLMGTLYGFAGLAHAADLLLGPSQVRTRALSASHPTRALSASHPMFNVQSPASMSEENGRTHASNITRL